MDISTDRNALAWPTCFSMTFSGKGQRVMGLIIPTLMPCFLAASIADLDTLEEDPYATMMMSASSARYSSAIWCFSLISAYLSNLALTRVSSSWGLMYRELTTLCSLLSL